MRPIYLAVASIIVHAILFVSIFDIYFTSPIDSGMEPQFCSMRPPAKRLVLFVADGLRADTVFSLNEGKISPAPYIRKIIEHKGRWGVSHTHVPTESRPGHVALIAGFYEDVSAVTRGWQENPVDFDSVFNKSRHTWSWGSPDILPMFAKGALQGKVETFMYDSNWEDFADSDASKLDWWVFEKVKEFFNKAKTDEHLSELLGQDQLVFFLHLLGIDTNGHAHRPKSKEVLDNLKFVDRGVEKIVELFESYYNDEKTAYVFTSDHGMTDWGSHGAGLPEETMTPLVCWGAGIKTPSANTYAEQVYHDGWSEKWGLDKYERMDVEQADIAPLMSTLIGIPMPIHSEGIVPMGCIHYNKGFLAETIYANTRQFFEQLRVKEERIYSTSLPFMFRVFPKLKSSDISELKLRIHSLLKNKQYQMAIDLLQDWLGAAKEGIRYYHTYHRFSLLLVMTLGFLSWILCVLLTILEDNIRKVHPLSGAPTVSRNFPTIVTMFSVLVCALLLYQSSSILYYFYYLLPTVCCTYAWRHRGFILHTWRVTKLHPVHIFKGIAVLLCVVFGLELLVLSFYFRQVLSVMLVFVSMWPYLTELVRKQLKLCVLWTICCLLLAVFPLLPVVGRNSNYILVLIPGVSGAVVCFGLLSLPQIKYLLCTPDVGVPKPVTLLRIQGVLLAVASFIPAVSNWYFSQKSSIPVLLNLFSWFNLLLSFVAPFFGPKSLTGRLLHTGLSLYTVFILLSTSFEAVFILLLCVTLYLWLIAEESLVPKNSKVIGVWESIMSYSQPKVVTLMPNENDKSERGLTLEDIRRVFFCIFFGVLSFFAIGNIASINTFDPATVYCFLTVFSPFVMGALILWKMIIPFIFVSSVFNSIMSILNSSLKTNLLIMLIMSDIMGLNFFFLVRDSGSWLEIGISISHYVIMMSMIIGIVILVGVARLITGVAVVPRKIDDHLF